MTAMLTADWFQLGRDSYYRKLEIYCMEWQQEVNMEAVNVCGSSYGGPIAVIRDAKKFIKVQGTGKPIIAIYSGSGRQISSIVWKHSQPVALGWSHQEHLLCVQDDGCVFIHDMFGHFKHMFKIERELSDVKVIDAKIFSSLQGTGVAILTSLYRVFLVNDVYNVKKRQLSVLPANCDQTPTSWVVVAVERHAEVLIACGRFIYRLGSDEAQCVPLTIDTACTHNFTAILEMAVSINGRHLALFTDAGYLWLGTSDLRSKYCEIHTECDVRPRQLMWCGTEAVVLSYENSVSVYGRSDGDVVTYAYDGVVHLITEIDGVRVLSGGQHELVQKVPPVVQKIFRINSTEPGSFLLEASKQYQKRSHRADEYICLVRERLAEAVSQCVEAAGYELDTDTQKMLIRAAQFGKCFLADTDPEEYVNMCRRLRVLNAVRDNRIGIALTYEQTRALTYELLLERLVSRKHFYLAIEIARFLRLPEIEGSSRILERWAKYKVMVPSVHQDEDMLAHQIADKVGSAAGVSYSEVARTAALGGRKRLAIRLLDYEPRARYQVPLLLELGESLPALVKATESGDTDLMYTVILSMREHMPVGDFRLTLRNYPAALALYKKYCQENNPQALQDIHVERDDFCAQADGYVRDSFDSGGANTREASLAAAHEAYKNGRAEFYATLCDESHRLLRAQKNFEVTYPDLRLYGLSVHDTCACLLQANDVKAAEKIRSDFKIPERRYWWLRIRNLAERDYWSELERLAKSKKSPIGYGPFVEVCLERNNKQEAFKYLARLPEDLKKKYNLKVE